MKYFVFAMALAPFMFTVSTPESNQVAGFLWECRGGEAKHSCPNDYAPNLDS